MECNGSGFLQVEEWQAAGIEDPFNHCRLVEIGHGEAHDPVVVWGKSRIEGDHIRVKQLLDVAATNVTEFSGDVLGKPQAIEVERFVAVGSCPGAYHHLDRSAEGMVNIR